MTIMPTRVPKMNLVTMLILRKVGGVVNRGNDVEHADSGYKRQSKNPHEPNKLAKTHNF